jgi:hypothetical protein
MADYTTDMSPELMLEFLPEKYANSLVAQILADNKGFSDTYANNIPTVQFASPGRTALIQKHYRNMEPQLEFWQKGDEDSLHPTKGAGTVLEIFNDELKKNPEYLKQAIFLDMLHGLGGKGKDGKPIDPYFWNLREQFINNYTPETLKFEESQGRKGVWGTGIESPYSRHDAYIRAKFAAPNAHGYSGWGDEKYSPEQLAIIEKMKRYVNTGEK